MSKGSRAMIAAFQMSLDAYMQGPNGEVEWVDSWNDGLDLISDVDAAVVGGGTYPGYEQLWGAVADDPRSANAMLGREATQGEIDYARWTQTTPHYVLSTSLDKVNWDKARIVRDVDELRSIKEHASAAIYVIGGAALVSRLLNEGLIDELRIIVHPIILGGGKAPFAGVGDRQSLELVKSEAGRSGRVVVVYRT